MGGGSKSKKKKSKSKGNKENAAKKGGGDGNVAGPSGCSRVGEQAGYGNQHGPRGHSTPNSGGGDGGNWRDLTVRVSSVEPKGQLAASPIVGAEVKNTIEKEEVRLSSAEGPEVTENVVETTSVEVCPTVVEAPDEFKENTNPALTESTSTPVAALLPLPQITPEPRRYRDRVRDVKVNCTSKLVNCLLEAELPLNVTSIPAGLDLYSSEMQKYEGHPVWDSYKFANRMPSGFSSISLAMKDESIEKIGTTDFVGDAECFKKIFMMSSSSDTVSLLMHRVGNSILVDNYELNDLLFRNTPVHVTEWDDFAMFALRVIDKEKSRIMFEDRTANRMHRKVALHDLLYKCLQGDITFKPVAEPVPLSNATQPPKIELKGANTNFMHTRLWEIGGYQFLVGSQVPLFRTPSEDSVDKGLKSDVETTIGVNNILYDKTLSSENGMNLWLDNCILDAKQTFLCHYKDSYVTATEVIKTEDIPTLASFDPVSIMEQAKDVLDFIKSFVCESGTTYWLYKGPDSIHFTLYDLSRGLVDADDEFETQCTSKAKSTTYNPYIEGIGSLLYRMCSLHATKYHPVTLQRMLRHILHIFPLESHPMLALSTILLHLESRIPGDMDSNFQPKLGVMNRAKVSDINFSYEWFGPDLDILIQTMEPEVWDQHLDPHLECYKKLLRIYEHVPIILSNLFRSSEYPYEHSKQFGIDRLKQMVAPLHFNISEIKPPNLAIGLIRHGGLSDDLKTLIEGYSSYLDKAEEDRIKSIQISKPEATHPNTASLVFSLLSYQIIEPMEISTPMTEHATGVNRSLNIIKFFELSGASRKTKAGSQSVTTPRSGRSKPKKMEKQAPPLVGASNQENSILPKTVEYKLHVWLNFCEQQDLIRVFIRSLRLMHQLNDKYIQQNLKQTKKTKKLEVPSEFLPSKKRLFDKIALFALYLAYEAAKPDSTCTAKVMMSRYCARLAIFLTKEFGESRQDIQTSAWLVSGHTLKYLITSKDEIVDVKIYTTKFEDGLREHCTEFLEIVKLALDKRKPELASEFKSYELFPYEKSAFHNSIREAYLRDYMSHNEAARRRTSEIISLELGNIGTALLSEFQEKTYYLEGRSKEAVENQTLEIVSDAIQYLDEAIKLSTSPKHSAQFYTSMAQVHAVRSQIIITRNESAPSASCIFMKACHSAYIESLQFWNKAVDILQPLETIRDILPLYNKARWEACNTHLEICNILWFLRNTNQAGLEEMQMNYDAALKLLQNEDFGEYELKDVVQYRKAEIYEALAMIRKQLSGSKSKTQISSATRNDLLPCLTEMFLPRVKFPYSSGVCRNMALQIETKSDSSELVAGVKESKAISLKIANNYYAACTTYANIQHYELALRCYLSYIDNKLAHSKVEEKLRNELMLLRDTRLLLENYLYKPTAPLTRSENPTPFDQTWTRNRGFDEPILPNKNRRCGIIKIFPNPGPESSENVLQDYIKYLQAVLDIGKPVLDKYSDINVTALMKRVTLVSDSLPAPSQEGDKRASDISKGMTTIFELVLGTILDRIQ